MVRAVVAVIFWLVAPFKNVADPLPLVVERVNVIVVVLLDGETVAVIVAVLPIGTTGVPEKITVGVTVAPAWGAGDALGQPLPPHIWPVYTVVPRYVAVMVADPTETPVTCPELLTVITEVLLLLQEEGPKE